MTEKRTAEEAKREEAAAIAVEMQALETRAHKAGLHVSAHAINNAKNALGWEAVGEIELAAKAGRGERPKPWP